MVVFMLSFIGVPPTLGFVEKFSPFQVVLQDGFVWLAVIGVMTSLFSAYYYLRVVVNMNMHEGDPEPATDGWLRLISTSTALGAVLLSNFSVPLFRWVTISVLKFF